MGEYYILDGHKVVPCSSVMEWAPWFESANRQVAKTVIGDATISTVFLGLNHRFSPDGPPLFFETMIFEGPNGGPYEDYQDRYSTWEEAEEGHKIAVELVKTNTPKF